MKYLFATFLLFIGGVSYSQTLDSLRLEHMKKTAAPLNSDRPGQTYSANTVGNKALMTQLGLEIGGHRLYSWDISSSSVKGTIDLRYGIGDRFEIGSFISGFSNQINTDLIEDRERNTSSYSLNARYTALSNDRNSLGFLADAAYGTDRQESSMTYSVKALYSVSITKSFSISSNLGFNTSEGSSWGNYTLNLGFPLFDDFGFFAEIYGDFGSDRNQYWIDGGIWYLIGPNVQLDAYFAKGFNNNVQDLYGTLGLTWRLIEPK